MSRPMILVFLLIFLIFTSQFEWKQQLANELEASSGFSQEQQRIANREEFVKEKIILSQEKDIQRLNELVQALQRQLLLCLTNIKLINKIRYSLSTNTDEIKQQQLLED